MSLLLYCSYLACICACFLCGMCTFACGRTPFFSAIGLVNNEPLGIPEVDDKKALVKALLDWQKAKPVPGPSTPTLCSVESKKVVKEPMNTSSLDSLLGPGEIQYEQLTIGRKLGSGGFKDCYAGKYMGEDVAIGELRVQNFTEMDITEIKHEINVLKQLRHENIIRFIGVCTNIKRLCIVTELCENGDLYDYMRKNKKPSFGNLIMYMHDVALACAYLHTRRPSIIHRDMKSMNVLISGDNRAKINDFGLARIRPKANASLHTQCGTPNWQAPEFWTPNPSYTEKVDVYACGLIYWEILSWGELGYPYHNFTEHQLYEAVRDREERPPLEKLRKYPQTLLALIQEMWRKDPKKVSTTQHTRDSNVVDLHAPLLSLYANLSTWLFI
ncbi:MAG: kinase-like domain-containing protein [Benniella sp.]|nr:MAG: kinase-like domain-containing protein [Benniella sp.]